VCVKLRGATNESKILVGKPEGKRDFSKDLGVDGKIK
jgi:hypothetical protein